MERRASQKRSKSTSSCDLPSTLQQADVLSYQPAPSHVVSDISHPPQNFIVDGHVIVADPDKDEDDDMNMEISGQEDTFFKMLCSS